MLTPRFWIWQNFVTLTHMSTHRRVLYHAQALKRLKHQGLCHKTHPLPNLASWLRIWKPMFSSTHAHVHAQARTCPLLTSTPTDLDETYLPHWCTEAPPFPHIAKNFYSHAHIHAQARFISRTGTQMAKTPGFVYPNAANPNPYQPSLIICQPMFSSTDAHFHAQARTCPQNTKSFKIDENQDFWVLMGGDSEYEIRFAHLCVCTWFWHAHVLRIEKSKKSKKKFF